MHRLPLKKLTLHFPSNPPSSKNWGPVENFVGGSTPHPTPPPSPNPQQERGRGCALCDPHLSWPMGCDIVWKRGNNRTKGCWFLNRRSRHLLHTCIEVWRKSHAEPAFLLVFFLWQKRIVFQSSLNPSFHLLITEFLWFV